MKRMQWVEKMSWTLWKVLPTAALLYALVWLPLEWHAQDVKSVDEGVMTTEVVSPKTKETKWDSIDMGTLLQWTSIRDLEWTLGWYKEKKPWMTGWWDGDGDDEINDERRKNHESKYTDLFKYELV